MEQILFQFCSRVGELEYCGEKSVAAAIGRNGTIHIHCYCSPDNFYHRLYRNSTGQYFKCVPVSLIKPYPTLVKYNNKEKQLSFDTARN